MSELATDLSNDILGCDEWDHNEIHSTHKNKIPECKILTSTIPFGQARKADVNVPPRHCGKVDSYIDDLITVALHTGNNAQRAANVVPLTFDIIGRPLSPWEPVPRDDLLSLIKLSAEGAMSEIQTVTGWEINTRKFLIALTCDKLDTWTASIKHILINKETNDKETDTLIGRLNHTGYIIPHSRHFLHPIRNLHSRCTETKSNKVRITELEEQYLQTWIQFLQYANKGISINNVIFRQPNHIR